jgi:hypothetical protein
MTLHRYAAIHGTTREQEAEYHNEPPPMTKEEIEDLAREMKEISELRRLFREEYPDE